MAEAPQARQPVGHHHDGPGVGQQLLHGLGALLLESLVPHGEHLVEEQDLRLAADGHGEGEAGEHARGVGAGGPVDGVAQLGVGHDVVEHRVDLGLLQPGGQPAQVDVAPPRELAVEPGAQGEHGGGLRAVDLHLAGVGRQGPGQHPQQGRLARPVRPDDPQGLALVDGERHVVHRHHRLLPAAQRGEAVVAQRGPPLGEGAELDRQVAGHDGRLVRAARPPPPGPRRRAPGRRPAAAPPAGPRAARGSRSACRAACRVGHPLRPLLGGGRWRSGFGGGSAVMPGTSAACAPCAGR